MDISSVSWEGRPHGPKGWTSLLSVGKDVHMDQRDGHLFCQLGRTSTWTKGMDISSVSWEGRPHGPKGCTSLLSVLKDVHMDQRDVHLFCQLEGRPHGPKGWTSLLSVGKDVHMDQRDGHLFCQLGRTSTWTTNVEKSSCHDGDFPVIVRHELSGVLEGIIGFQRTEHKVPPTDRLC